MPFFRSNVAALILCQGHYLGCRRADHGGWQCVQGGMEVHDASPAHAIEREIQEELGLEPSSFRILSQSRFWRRYHFPFEIRRQARFADNLGQEQRWFLVELFDFQSIQLERSCGEFSEVKLYTIQDLMGFYSAWKKASFFDFCRELGLVP